MQGLWADEADGMEEEDDMDEFLDSCDDSGEEEEEGGGEVLPSLLQWAQSNQEHHLLERNEGAAGAQGGSSEGRERLRKETLEKNRALHGTILDMLKDIEKMKERNRDKWKDMQAQREDLMRIIDGRKVEKFRRGRWREGRHELAARKDDSESFFGINLLDRHPDKAITPVEHSVAGWRLSERRVLVNEVANCCTKMLFLQGQGDQLLSARKHEVLLSEPCRKVLQDPKLWEEVGKIMWRKLKRGSEESFVQFTNVDDPKITRKEWSKEQEKLLVSSVKSGLSWAEIGRKMEEKLQVYRPPVDLFTYYQRVHNGNLVRTGNWTKEEDEVLVMAMKTIAENDWVGVARYIQERGCNRNEQQCLQRWKRINPDLKKGPWSPEEDEVLQQAVKSLAPWASSRDEDGELRDPRELSKSMPWIEIAKLVPGRRADQVRDHWIQKHPYRRQQARPWKAEEHAMLEDLVKEYGVGRWAQIATSFPGRTPRQCRLHWERTHKDEVHEDRVEKIIKGC